MTPRGEGGMSMESTEAAPAAVYAYLRSRARPNPRVNACAIERVRARARAREHLCEIKPVCSAPRLGARTHTRWLHVCRIYTGGILESHAKMFRLPVMELHELLR